MDKNVGNTDRLIRIVAGLAIIGAGVVFQSWLGAIGLIPLFTATIRWCPLYVPIKFSSCKKESAE